MSSKTTLFKLALGGLYFGGAYHCLKNRFRGVGALLTLHHVAPAPPARRFSPNRILEITPEFLEKTILQVRQMGYEIVSLDEFRRRLIERDFRSPFVGFTLDDGYADNYHHAFPIFQKHRAPFAIYICTGLLDGRLDLWWQDLEDIVSKESNVELSLNGVQRKFDTVTTRHKFIAYETIYWALRRMPLEQQLNTIRFLKERYGDNIGASSSSNAPLSRDMITEMLNSGLLTIGAHTVNHYALNKLAPDDVQEEMALSRRRIEEQTGIKPLHFAYPYGDRFSAAGREFEIAQESGFLTSVTTRKGVIFAEHAQHLNALPRISLNGDYQRLRYINLFLSGLPFALFNGFRRLNVD